MIMYDLEYTGTFKKDVKRIKKRAYETELLANCYSLLNRKEVCIFDIKLINYMENTPIVGNVILNRIGY